MNNYKYNKFCDMFGQLYTQEYKATKMQIVRLYEKKSKENQTRLMRWYWKRKPTWRKDLTAYNSHLGCFLLNDWLSFGKARLKLDVQGQGGQKHFGCRWTRGVGACITASRKISLKLLMAPSETTEPLTFWYVVA